MYSLCPFYTWEHKCWWTVFYLGTGRASSFPGSNYDALCVCSQNYTHVFRSLCAFSDLCVYNHICKCVNTSAQWFVNVYRNLQMCIQNVWKFYLNGKIWNLKSNDWICRFCRMHWKYKEVISYKLLSFSVGWLNSSVQFKCGIEQMVVVTVLMQGRLRLWTVDCACSKQGRIFCSGNRWHVPS